MKSSKVIEVSKASLISLKAELSRKQEEVNKAKKESQASYIQPLPRPKKQEKSEENQVTEKDTEKSQEDEELHRKSRSTLEAKAKLYDKLMEASSSKDEDENNYLVNFEQKAFERKDEERKKEEKKEEKDDDDDDDEHNSDDYGSPSDSEDEWVDYTDCLGRTRRCLKRDLDFVKDKDIQLAKSLGFGAEKDSEEESSKQEITGPLMPDLMSSDMRREQLRQKWEEQEELLKDKKDIHYQDVLFDEARTHGVGYFSFAQDEDTRRQQQEALARQRAETRRQQLEAKDVRRRRQAALEARVRAARNRQRARLGLPPEEPVPVAVDDESKEEDEEKEREVQMEADRRAKKEEALKKSQILRPWDIGKEKRKPFEEMSQEDWVKKKRKERVDEFAPPQFYQEKSRKQKNQDKDHLSESDSDSSQDPGRESSQVEIGPLPLQEEIGPVPLPPKRKSLFFSSKEQRAQSSQATLVSLPGNAYVDVSKPPPSVNKSFLYSRETTTCEESAERESAPPKYKKIINEVSNPIEISSDEEEQDSCARGKGKEIAPPPTYEYYGPCSTQRKGMKKTHQKEELEKSISVGLQYLRKRQEEKEKKGDRGLLDII